ncbi:MAG: IPTL-CTERM sorting domain-containing protein, partial [Cocleimonas sp.]
DENGKYLFEDLPAGDFTITVDESTLSEALQGKNTVDPNGGNDSVSTVTLDGSSSNLDQDFAYVALGSIGDAIWQDTNHDGVVDAGDTMLSGVTVTLTPPADIDLGAGLGKPITTTTDGDGKYLFPDLPAGNYTVVVDPSTLPAGLANTVDPDGGFNSTSSVALGEGENDLDQDFAYAEVGHISGTVLEDTDADDTGDAPMSNVVLQLLDSNGDPVLDANDNPITTTTDTEGNYQFLNLLPGDYQISQVQPAGYESVSDVDGEAKDNLIGSITVTGGNTEVANDFVELRASPAPPPTGEPIPTLSEWMLMMLALLLLFAGKRESLRFSGRKF